MIESDTASPGTGLRRAVTTAAQLARQRADPMGRTLPAPDSLVPYSRKHSLALVRGLGIDIATDGNEPETNQPLLIASNHVSWLDPYVINSVFGARFVAKHEVEGWFVIGSIARRFGSFFHKRGCFRDAWRLVEAAQAALQEGYRVGFFPEATTGSGDFLRPFFPALFQAAVDSGTCVQPVAIRYTTPSGELSTAAAWDGQMSFAESVKNYLQAPRIHAEVRVGPQIEPGNHRRELAGRTEDAIDRLLFPERTEARERERADWEVFAGL